MKRVSKALLDRWQDRVSQITSHGFAFSESEADRDARIARAKRDYAFFVATYFPHLASKPTASFQIEAARWIASE